jgi:peptidoglycan/LPS O-acetylase OafA/YrhL
MPNQDSVDSAPSRMLLLDALRALAATIITWHHFSWYGPLSDYADPLIGSAISILANYGRVTQVFFVIAGYVMARSMTGRTWGGSQVGRYVCQRYVRLGLPYLVAVALAIGACTLGRGWLPSEVVDPPPTIGLILAHVFLVQKILGYDSFAAGQWFVCVIFQLSIVFAVMLFLRDRWTAWFPGSGRQRATVLMLIAGWILATSSLFYFNVGDTWENWYIYFFPQFFLGVLVYYGLQNRRAETALWLYLLLVVAALTYSFRWPLVNALITGLILIGATKWGIMEKWPKSRLVGYLGRTSYSLFLIHFIVLVVVATVWVRLGWTEPAAALAGLVVAYILSLATSFVFYHLVEVPADHLSRRFN